MKLRIADLSDNISAICVQMTPDNWAVDNEMSQYNETHLRRFLSEDKNILLLAWDDDKIAGATLCYILPHPDGNDTLYVHELDTHPDYRRQGVATQLMNELLSIARQKGLSEVWLGTEIDNPAANELYKKLGPSEIEQSVTYTYKVS